MVENLLFIKLKGDDMINKSYISPGDVVRVWRGIYYHYGVVAHYNEIIHLTGNSKAQAKVQITSLGDFSQGEVIEKVSPILPSFPPEIVVTRALSFVGASGYNISQRNCEHFAWYCKTNHSISLQFNRVLVITVLLGLGVSAIWSVRK